MKEEAERFAAVAREFCDLVEKAPELEPAYLRERLVRILPALYLAGLDLPFEAPDDEDDFEYVDLQLDCVALSNRLGKLDWYWEVYNPMQKEGPLETSIAFDLAEMRNELQQGLLALDRGETVEAVVWHWRFGLDNHWGNHLVDALRAIHWARGW